MIEGQVETSKAVVKEHWDLIIFTGSPEKGKLVSMAAAENLTPCILGARIHALWMKKQILRMQL